MGCDCREEQQDGANDDQDMCDGAENTRNTRTLDDFVREIRRTRLRLRLRLRLRCISECDVGLVQVSVYNLR